LRFNFAHKKCEIMNSGKYVFRQLLDFVNQYEFNKCIKRYILSVSAFDRTPIRDLLTLSQVNQNVKELQDVLFDNMY
jgi:hypothetical protein